MKNAEFKVVILRANSKCVCGIKVQSLSLRLDVNLILNDVFSHIAQNTRVRYLRLIIKLVIVRARREMQTLI